MDKKPGLSISFTNAALQNKAYQKLIETEVLGQVTEELKKVIQEIVVREVARFMPRFQARMMEQTSDYGHMVERMMHVHVTFDGIPVEAVATSLTGERKT